MYRGTTVIGNDVWIGRDAVIFDGVTIGHGAVIGTRALVTKDVRPYAIVAGVPAKEIRRRFTDEQVDALLEIAWWDWPDEKVLAEADALNGEHHDFLARHSLSGVVSWPRRPKPESTRPEPKPTNRLGGGGVCSAGASAALRLWVRPGWFSSPLNVGLATVCQLRQRPRSAQGIGSAHRFYVGWMQPTARGCWPLLQAVAIGFSSAG